MTRSLGGARVIAWSLVFSLPVTLPLSAVAITLQAPVWTLPAVGALAYVSIVSSLIGFMAWYHGLSHGGVARVGALQLAQPLLGVVWCALLLGEPVTRAEVVAVVAIAPCIVLARAFAKRE